MTRHVMHARNRFIRAAPSSFRHQAPWLHRASTSLPIRANDDSDKRSLPPNNGSRLDSRVWPIAASTFVTGSAIGVALPVMPLFCAELGLSAAEFGLMGSAMGLSRLTSNLPLAVAAER